MRERDVRAAIRRHDSLLSRYPFINKTFKEEIKMFKNMKIGLKLILTFSIIGLIAIAIIGYIGYNTAKKSLEEQAFQQLQSVRDIKKNQIQDFFEERLGDLEVYSVNTAMVTAMERFVTAFNAQNRIGGEAWNRWNNFHGPKLEKYVDVYHYYDLLMISPNGDVVFTVEKEGDLGQNVATGALANSVLAKAFNKGKTGYGFTDYEWFEISDEPAAFVSGPVRDTTGNLIGVLVYQIALESVNEIMQERSGMGETGESYLIGNDKRMRSDSYLDPTGHSVEASLRGTIENNGVDTEAANEALAGKSDHKIIVDYNGKQVLSAYAPVDILGAHWAILSEINEAEAFAPVYRLRNQILIWAAILILIVIGVSVLFSLTITRPLQVAVDVADQISKGNIYVNFEVTSKDEIGKLLTSMKDMVAYIQEVADVAQKISEGDIQVEVTTKSNSDVLNQAFQRTAQYVQDAANVADKISVGDVSSIEVKPKSDKDVYNQAVLRTVAYLQEVAEVSQKLAIGNINVSVTPKSANDILNQSFGQMITYLQEVAELAEKIAENDLRVEVTPKSNQDVLNRSLKRMTDNLKVIVQRLLESSDMVLSSATQLSENSQRIEKGADEQASATEETSASIEQIASSISQVASNTDSLSSNVSETSASIEQMTTSIDSISKNVSDLSASVDETSSTIEEMAASIEQVAVNAREVTKSSEDAVQEAESGGESVNQAIEGMSEIAETMQDIVKVIQNLDESSKKINSIVDVIDEIAEQTNLLALNAAIEAARAGEHGRGFAVVADEVRDLAERSAESAKEIVSLITGVQEETQRAIKVTDEGYKKVNQGVELAGNAGTALDKISQAIRQVNQMMQEVSKVTNQQAKASDQIVNTVENMRRMTQQVDNATQEQSSSSNQIMKAVEVMNKMTAQVANATNEQKKSGEQIVKAVDNIAKISGQNKDVTQQIVAAVEGLNKQGENLREITATFKLR